MVKGFKKNTKALIFSALFTAVLCVFSQIAIPTPAIPITLQVFGVALCGYLLGARLSVLSVAPFQRFIATQREYTTIAAKN